MDFGEIILCSMGAAIILFCGYAFFNEPKNKSPTAITMKVEKLGVVENCNVYDICPSSPLSCFNAVICPNGRASIDSEHTTGGIGAHIIHTHTETVTK